MNHISLPLSETLNALPTSYEVSTSGHGLRCSACWDPASFSGLITLPHSPFLSWPPARWQSVLCALAGLSDRQMHTGSFLSLGLGSNVTSSLRISLNDPIHIALLPHPLSYYLFCFLDSIFPCLKSSFSFTHPFVPCLLCLTREWQFQKRGPFLFGPPPFP